MWLGLLCSWINIITFFALGGKDYVYIYIYILIRLYIFIITKIYDDND